MGITLFGSLEIDAHFSRLATKVERVVALLGRLLPNIGGPGNNVAPPVHRGNQIQVSIPVTDLSTRHYEGWPQNSAVNTKKNGHSRLLHCLK